MRTNFPSENEGEPQARTESHSKSPDSIEGAEDMTIPTKWLLRADLDSDNATLGQNPRPLLTMGPGNGKVSSLCVTRTAPHKGKSITRKKPPGAAWPPKHASCPASSR